MAEVGLCQCGCGARTNIVSHSVPSRGITKGEPRKYLIGHASRVRVLRPYRGGRRTAQHGYQMVAAKSHPKSDEEGYVMEHVIVAEAALGKILPEGAVVHHVDGYQGNNANGNLVICQDQSYHMLLHVRQKAFSACGNAGFARCTVCKGYDDPSLMNSATMKSGVVQRYHVACMTDKINRWKRNRKHA